MKVLIDECSPRALKNHLINHGYECSTVQEAGSWLSLHLTKYSPEKSSKRGNDR